MAGKPLPIWPARASSNEHTPAEAADLSGVVVDTAIPLTGESSISGPRKTQGQQNQPSRFTEDCCDAPAGMLCRILRFLLMLLSFMYVCYCICSAPDESAARQASAAPVSAVDNVASNHESETYDGSTTVVKPPAHTKHGHVMVKSQTAGFVPKRSVLHHIATGSPGLLRLEDVVYMLASLVRVCLCVCVCVRARLYACKLVTAASSCVVYQHDHVSGPTATREDHAFYHEVLQALQFRATIDPGAGTLFVCLTLLFI